MSKVALIIFIVSLTFQLFFSVYYSQNTFNYNQRFQKLNAKIINQTIANNQLQVQVATNSALTVFPAASFSASYIDLRNEP
jgi:cell division protein FtsL